MPYRKPLTKKGITKDGLICLELIRPLSPKHQEIYNAILVGYNTRYALQQFYTQGSISAFIKVGLESGFLTQTWITENNRTKAILKIVC